MLIDSSLCDVLAPHDGFLTTAEVVAAARALPESLLAQHLAAPAVTERETPNAAEARGVASKLGEAARSWYAEHGRPWLAWIALPIERLDGDHVVLGGGAVLTSETLVAGLRQASAECLCVAGLSAGQELDAEIDRLWSVGRPDGAMALHAYGVAVVEHLRATLRARLEDLVRRSFTDAWVLPHYSPGHEGWGLFDQEQLFDLLPARGPLSLGESGALQPSKSTLTAFGVSRAARDASFGDAFWFHHPSGERSSERADTHRAEEQYSFPEKALKKWSAERLQWRGSGPSLEASFRFDGTTCSSLGRPLRILYTVSLMREIDGYRIRGARCAPDPSDVGLRSTCASIADAGALEAALERDVPRVGQRLADVLCWTPEVSPSGCVCSRGNRFHKWRMALQTIHYALLSSSEGEPCSGNQESGTEEPET